MVVQLSEFPDRVRANLNGAKNVILETGYPDQFRNSMKISFDDLALAKGSTSTSPLDPDKRV